MATVARLAVSLSANTTKFDKGMRRAGSSVRKFSMGASLAKAALIGLAVVIATKIVSAIGSVIRGFTNLVKAQEQLNRSMQESLAIMGDVSDAMREKMTKAAFDVAKVTKFSANDAAKSYFFLASAGLDTAQSIAALPVVARFAQAGMFDMARATDLLTDAQSALGLTVKDTEQNMVNMTRVSDVLARSNQLANTSVEQMGDALTNKAGAALKMVNKDIEEGVAVLAAFADQGVKGAEAGTAFSIIMRDLQTKAIKNKKAFQEMGVEIFDSAGKMNNLASIIEQLETLLGGLSDEQKKATLLFLGFSDKSVSYTQSILGMSERIAEYEKKLRSAGGTTKEIADKQLTKFQKGMEKLKAVMGQLFTIFQPLIDALGTFLGFLADGVETLDKFIRKVLGLKAAMGDAEASTAKSAMRAAEGADKKRLNNAKRLAAIQQAAAGLGAGLPGGTKSVKAPALKEAAAGLAGAFIQMIGKKLGFSQSTVGSLLRGSQGAIKAVNTELGTKQFAKTAEKQLNEAEKQTGFLQKIAGEVSIDGVGINVIQMNI